MNQSADVIRIFDRWFLVEMRMYLSIGNVESVIPSRERGGTVIRGFRSQSFRFLGISTVCPFRMEYFLEPPSSAVRDSSPHR